jgi:hypothetical protein
MNYPYFHGHHDKGKISEEVSDGKNKPRRNRRLHRSAYQFPFLQKAFPQSLGMPPWDSAFFKNILPFQKAGMDFLKQAATPLSRQAEPPPLMQYILAGEGAVRTVLKTAFPRNPPVQTK